MGRGQLDDRVEQALRAGTIKLLSADFIRMGFLMRMKPRAALEKLEKEEGKRCFLPAYEAADILAKGARAVCCLSYPWLTPMSPDPYGSMLSHAKSFLRSREGAHVQGLYWDWACVPQLPRTPEEQTVFTSAVSLMGELYASPMGTCVLRQLHTPPRPEELDGGRREALECVATIPRLPSFGNASPLPSLVPLTACSLPPAPPQA